MGQNNNLHYDVHVYERDSFGTGSWLQRKSSTYAFDTWEAHHCREGMVRYIFPWRTVAYRWVNMVIKGIAWLHNSFIPASDLGLLYIGKTTATLSRPREYPSPALEFGVTFTDISVSGQCNTLILCRRYTWKGRIVSVCTLCRCFTFQGDRSTKERQHGNMWRAATGVTKRWCVKAVSTNAKEWLCCTKITTFTLNYCQARIHHHHNISCIMVKQTHMHHIIYY